MAVILIGVPLRLWLRCIVNAPVVAGGLAGKRGLSSHNCAAFLEMQAHMALEVNREAEIHSRREENHTATRCLCRFDGVIHSVGIQRLAVSRRAEIANIEKA